MSPEEIEDLIDLALVEGRMAADNGNRTPYEDVLKEFELPPSRREPQPCPSYAAYQRHLKNGEEICPGCKVARREYEAKWRLSKGRSPRVLKPCGTEAAYRRHLRHGEKACEACLDAHHLRD